MARSRRKHLRGWFKKKLPKLIRLIFNKSRPTAVLHALWALASSPSHLKSVGWFESYRRRLPVTSAGEPIPWYTYAAIAFLEPRIQPSMSVFEYGSGHSTLWWSRRAARVVSCEHDRGWHALLKSRLPAHVEYLWRELQPDGEYARSITTYGAVFDIVIVDGRDRNHCARYAIGGLLPGGVIIWDNSDRQRYQEGFDLLIASGFRRLDFHGMGAMAAGGWCTSVFYKSDNCLGL